MSLGVASELSHRTLECHDGVPLAEARMTDRERLAVLLEGSCLLAHLELAGWRLGCEWSRSCWDGRELRSLSGEPGRSTDLPQASLSALLELLFAAAGGLAGRGEARRAARRLLGLWRQRLVRVPTDLAVEQVLTAAPFLWDSRFAANRMALLGAHRGPAGWRLWVAGPGGFRSRLLRRAASRPEAEALLGGVSACRLWSRCVGPVVVRPVRSSVVSRVRRLAEAREHFEAARFEDCLRVLRGNSTLSTRVLRIRAQERLGRCEAASRGLARLPWRSLTPTEIVDLGEVALRVLANTGRVEGVEEWMRRLAAVSRGREGLRSHILRAVAACDAGRDGAVRAHLEAARDALGIPGLAWQWHHAAAVRALEAGDAPVAVEELGQALRLRRRQSRPAAAGLWNDLALARAMTGRLASAERAALHAVRLLDRCQGPRGVTLALCNLAEIRLRRGRLEGVAEVLDRVAAHNRLSGNWRGRIQDAELAARLALVRGCPEEAWRRVREALGWLEVRGSSWHAGQLQVLAARALGWLGRPRPAARALAEAGGSVCELEPEERPAVWALAGQRRRGAEAACGVTAALWRSLLADRRPAGQAWEALRSLEAYRAARTVLDCELVTPGAAPPVWRRRAAEALRRVGAEELAERLEVREAPAWEALGAYCAEPRPRPEALTRLFVGAGYRRVRLCWRHGGREEILVDGDGGSESLRRPAAGGELVLQAPAVDAVLGGLLAVVARDLSALPARGRTEAPSREGGFVGESPVLLRALERLDRLARVPLPLLILGETGTGKELAARRAHALSGRRRRPFVAVNCAALSETLLIAELFGHARGAFTGADRERAGVFEAADGGSLFLDEIGDLPRSAQGKLLRVLQEREVRRLGETTPRRVDVRVITATHRALEAMVEEGSFRRDLYYRLRGGWVELPPLRRRGDDVLLLADAFLARWSGGGSRPRLTGGARAALRAYPWPGNVRELQNVLAVALALAEDGVVTVASLDLPHPTRLEHGRYHERIESLRRRLVREALEACGGNRSRAARQLGLSRQALSYLARRFALSDPT